MSGYRTIFLFALLWFFGARVEHEVEGVFISIFVGGFSNKAECEKYRLQAADVMRFAGGQIAKECISKEEI